MIKLSLIQPKEPNTEQNLSNTSQCKFLHTTGLLPYSCPDFLGTLKMPVLKDYKEKTVTLCGHHGHDNRCPAVTGATILKKMATNLSLFDSNSPCFNPSNPVVGSPSKLPVSFPLPSVWAPDSKPNTTSLLIPRPMVCPHHHRSAPSLVDPDKPTRLAGGTVSRVEGDAKRAWQGVVMALANGQEMRWSRQGALWDSVGKRRGSRRQRYLRGRHEGSLGALSLWRWRVV